MSDLQQQSIKITGIEERVAVNGSIFFNIKDENNRSYKLWKTIKDGSDSKAYSALMALPNKGIGQVIDAGVELQPGEYNGKSITYRTIKVIGPFLGSNTSAQGATTSMRANPPQSTFTAQNEAVLAKLDEIEKKLDLILFEENSQDTSSSPSA